MIACRASNHYAVKPLLAVGANPNLPNKSGFVPLHYACYNGNVDTVRALLESYEVDVNFQAKGSASTPLHFAQQVGSLSPPPFFYAWRFQGRCATLRHAAVGCVYVSLVR